MIVDVIKIFISEFIIIIIIIRAVAFVLEVILLLFLFPVLLFSLICNLYSAVISHHNVPM